MKEYNKFLQKINKFLTDFIDVRDYAKLPTDFFQSDATILSNQIGEHSDGQEKIGLQFPRRPSFLPTAEGRSDRKGAKSIVAVYQKFRHWFLQQIFFSVGHPKLVLTISEEVTQSFDPF